MSTERLKKHVARVQAESTTFKKKLKSEGGSLRAELAKARQREYEAIGFTFASCAAWEATGRKIGTMRVTTLIDAWEKARTAVLDRVVIQKPSLLDQNDPNTTNVIVENIERKT